MSAVRGTEPSRPATRRQIQPDNVTADLPWEAVMFVRIRRGWGRPSSSTQGRHWVRSVHASPEELRR